MRKIFILILCSLILCPVSSHAQNVDVNGSVPDDVCAFMSIAVEKKLSKRFDLGLEGEFRSRDNASQFERISLSPSLDYKIMKRLKFTVGGMYIYNNNAAKNHHRSDGSLKWTRRSYWQPRYRGYVSVTGDVDLGRFNIALRERYQLTYRREYTATRDYFMRDGTFNYTEDDVRKNKTSQVFRSRLTVSYDIYHSPLEPFVSMEMTNEIDGFAIDKIRYTGGVDWKVNKKNTVGIEYMYQDMRADDGEDDANSHVIALSYKYKF